MRMVDQYRLDGLLRQIGIRPFVLPQDDDDDDGRNKVARAWHVGDTHTYTTVEYYLVALGSDKDQAWSTWCLSTSESVITWR